MSARAKVVSAVADILVVAAVGLVFFGLYRMWGIGAMCLVGGPAVGTLGVLIGRGSKAGAT